MSNQWPIAYCPACEQQAQHDSLGCRTCRHRAAAKSDAITARNRQVAAIGVLGLATAVGIAIGVSKGDGAEKADDKPAESPGLRVPVPPVFLGETEVARDVARQLVAWCGYQGAVQLWRGDHTAETTDATGGIYNVSVEHVEK